MKNCNNCGKELEENAAVCESCGTLTDTEEQRQIPPLEAEASAEEQPPIIPDSDIPLAIDPEAQAAVRAAGKKRAVIIIIAAAAVAVLVALGLIISSVVSTNKLNEPGVITNMKVSE